MKTNITIGTVKVNTIDKLGRFSSSSTFQVGNHVTNKKVEAFGEHNGDRGIFQSPVLSMDDSDVIDSDFNKEG